jgi:hypothetical protein
VEEDWGCGVVAPSRLHRSWEKVSFVACARGDQRSRVAYRLSGGAIGREVEGEWNGPVLSDLKRGVGKNYGDMGERGCSYASCFNI